MEPSASLWERCEAGETLHFGDQVWLDRDTLFLAGQQVPLNTINPLSLDESGNLVVVRIGTREPWLVVPTADLENIGPLLEVVNRLVEAVPYIQRRSVTGWPPASVGDLSARIGCDVRDLWMAGYSDDQIRTVLSGERSLDELLKSAPQKGKGRRRRRRKS